MSAFILTPKNSGLEKYKEIAFSYLKNTESSRIIKVRGEDIPFLVKQYYEKGKKAIGLTGEDLYKEYIINDDSKNLKILKKISWNDQKTLFGKPALCLLGPKNKNLEELGKKFTIYIAAKYRNTANKYLESLESKGYKFKKVYINGCVEAIFSEGLADLIIDIVYTGKTMQESGLKVYEKIQQSDFLIICTQNIQKANQK